MVTLLCLIPLALALLPALLFLDNLQAFRRPDLPHPDAPRAEVSVLIPARDEEGSIGAAVSSALASVGVVVEVIVLDDNSHDTTAAIVADLASRDPRVVLREAPPLPDGWCGKQHACAVLAGLASKPILVFIDADVRLAPDGLASAASFLERSGADLVSGIPRQETGGVLERLVIPLIHFVLLGFLPIRQMRKRTEPSYAAGCGQLFVTWKASYDRMGGHSAVRTTLHDGLKLPRAYRASGLKTDLFDATGVADCRMYRSPSDLWNGLAKNAVEGLAAPGMIVPATFLLFGGQVLPVLLLAASPALGLSPSALAVVVAAVFASYLPRVVAVFRFDQPVLGAILHPLGVLVLLAIQWYAFTRDALGRQSTWKGRPYPARTG